MPRRPGVQRPAPRLSPGALYTPMTGFGSGVLSAQAEKMVLAHALEEGEPGDVVGLDPAVLPRHTLLSAATGGGKSVTAIHAAVSGHAAIDEAPTLVIDPKGDWARDLCRAQFAVTGDLDDVVYFDAAEHLPALSFFDVSRGVDAGRARTRVVQDIVDHFLDILAQLVPEGFDAIRAPDIIEYLIWALFDPVEGQDAFTITDLTQRAYALRQDGEIPPLAAQNDWVADVLDNLAYGHDRGRQDAVFEGAITRLEKIYGNGYLRPLFSATPGAENAFSFSDLLDEDVLVVFDLGALSQRGTRVVANVLLSLLWRALTRRLAATTPPRTTPAPVLTFIDEVPQLGIDDRLQQLFDLGRGYGLALVAIMQYPQQVDTPQDHTTYQSLLNNCQSILAGRHVTLDALPGALAGPESDEQDVTDRLRGMRQDQFLFRPATPFGDAATETRLVQNLPLPPGHPDATGDTAFTAADAEAFVTALRERIDTTASDLGVPYEPYTEAAFASHDTTPSATPTTTQSGQSMLTYPTTLPFLTDLPGQATYDSTTERIVCASCDTAYDPDVEGLIAAVNCHGKLAAHGDDAIPPVELGLELSPATLRDLPYSETQLAFCQAVYNATQGRYSRREYDIVHDSMASSLRNRFGLSAKDVAALTDDGILNETNHPHKLYWLQDAEFRSSVLDEPHLYGEAHGPGIDDPDTSAVHVLFIEAAHRYFTDTRIEDPEHPVEELRRFYEPPEFSDPTRFDLVGLDAAGDIRLIAEGERTTGTPSKSAPQHFDAMQQYPDADHHWVVATRDAGHTILNALANPHPDLTDTTPRIQYDYSTGTPLSDIVAHLPDIDGIHLINDLISHLSSDT